MKKFPIHIPGIIAILIGAAFQLQADSSSAIASLKSQLQHACEARDLNAVKQCYDFDGAPPALVDEEMSEWEEYFDLSDKTTHWVFEKVVYTSLDQIKADKTIDQRTILLMTEPQKMNGTVYEPNLKVVGFVTVTFKQGPGEEDNMEPIGIAADGTARLVMSWPVK